MRIHKTNIPTRITCHCISQQQFKTCHGCEGLRCIIIFSKCVGGKRSHRDQECNTSKPIWSSLHKIKYAGASATIGEHECYILKPIWSYSTQNSMSGGKRNCWRARMLHSETHLEIPYPKYNVWGQAQLLENKNDTP